MQVLFQKNHKKSLRNIFYCVKIEKRCKFIEKQKIIKKEAVTMSKIITISREFGSGGREIRQKVI